MITDQFRAKLLFVFSPYWRYRSPPYGPVGRVNDLPPSLSPICAQQLFSRSVGCSNHTVHALRRQRRRPRRQESHQIRLADNSLLIKCYFHTAVDQRVSPFVRHVAPESKFEFLDWIAVAVLIYSSTEGDFHNPVEITFQLSTT